MLPSMMAPVHDCELRNVLNDLHLRLLDVTQESYETFVKDEYEIAHR